MLAYSVNVVSQMQDIVINHKDDIVVADTVQTFPKL